MSDIKSNIKDLAMQVESVAESLNIPKKKKRLEILIAESLKPGFWDDNENATNVMQELGDIKKEIDEIENLTDEIGALSGLSEEGGDLDFDKDVGELGKRLSKLKMASFMTGKYDRGNAIVSIHAGQGGVEAMDWTNILYRMYGRFFERRGWKYSNIDMSEGEEAGLKSVVFRVAGQWAYGYLKGEAGTHRLVRQSPFNADKLRQTSFALVEVLPELASTDASDIEINPDELEIQFFRASGHGGQNVNKVSTAVRIIHKPSGIVVSAQTERKQTQNRDNAMALLRAKLWAKKQEEQEAQKTELKGTYQPASWGTQIRSYVLHPYKMVKDLRTKVETSDSDGVLDGDLDEFIEAEVMQL
jgi:peptide chain release factor 2